MRLRQCAKPVVHERGLEHLTIFIGNVRFVTIRLMMMENANQNTGAFLVEVGRSVQVVAGCLLVMVRQDSIAIHASIPWMMTDTVRTTHATFATLIHAIRVIPR